MSIPLEDNFNDILAKAQRGLGLDDITLQAQSGVNAEDLAKLKEGISNPDALRRIAPVLGLNPEALVESAQKIWTPTKRKPIPGFLCFNTPFEDMTVNSYLVWDQETKEGVAFDTGSDASDMLEAIEKNAIRLQALLITHTHGDHIFDLDRVCEKTRAPAYVGDKEPRLKGSTPFVDGRIWHISSLDIESRLTWGHAQGGISFVVHGLAKTLAVVGDALFAGSMGGGMVSYRDALKTSRDQILSLPNDTVICPGHGPLTTVGEEKVHNPFFAI